MSDTEESKTNIVLFKTPPWGVLGTAFIVMLIGKCFGYAPDLSWWIVTCPLWGPFALTLAFLAAFYAFAFISIAVIGLIGVVIAFLTILYDFFKKFFKQNKDNSNSDNEYKLHS